MRATQPTEGPSTAPLFGMMEPTARFNAHKIPQEPQAYDRGQKKCHTRKNLVVINEPCHMCCLSHTDEGKASEQSLAELAGYTLPPGS